jgi:uncharacterized phiE125 gp8 family phage protein
MEHSPMKVKLITAPTIEPITISEMASHLRIDDYDTFATNMTPYICTAAGSHIVTTGYTLYGTAVDVLGKKALVYIRPVNNGTGGTVDCKIQESDDSTTWTDWTGGSFTQITESTDTTTQEKEYTGTKRYIRTASKILVAACEFGTDVFVSDSSINEYDYLVSIIKAARRNTEDITRRQLITATWEYYLDRFPRCEDYITIPFGNLQSVTSIKYKDCDWASVADDNTMVEGTDYIVELNSEGCGRIVLPYGMTWPSDTLYTSNPITIKFVCGYGTTTDTIPEEVKAAMKLIATDLYVNREGQIVQNGIMTYLTNKTVMALLSSLVLREEF